MLKMLNQDRRNITYKTVSVFQYLLGSHSINNQLYNLVLSALIQLAEITHIDNKANSNNPKCEITKGTYLIPMHPLDEQEFKLHSSLFTMTQCNRSTMHLYLRIKEVITNPIKHKYPSKTFKSDS